MCMQSALLDNTIQTFNLILNVAVPITSCNTSALVKTFVSILMGTRSNTSDKIKIKLIPKQSIDLLKYSLRNYIDGFAIRKEPQCLV